MGTPYCGIEQGGREACSQTKRTEIRVLYLVAAGGANNGGDCESPSCWFGTLNLLADKQTLDLEIALRPLAAHPFGLESQVHSRSPVGSGRRKMKGGRM